MKSLLLLGSVFTFGLLAGCASKDPVDDRSLKDVYRKDFLVGVAVNEAQSSGQDKRGIAIIQQQFNAITPENILKWESVHPQPDRYDFTAPDRYVQFGERNHMIIVGHTLIWHNQTPAWVFQDQQGQPVDRDTLLQRMRDHIHTVVGRYKGRIKAWDVVNEALNEDGTLRDTPWRRIIGDDYIAKAFQYAHEADPRADLTYNDYALEKEPKRNGVVALLKNLKTQGVPVTGLGTQMHVKLESPSAADIRATFDAFATLKLKVMVTELDVDVLPSARDYITNNNGAITSVSLTNFSSTVQTKLNPYTNGLPYALRLQLGQRYADIFSVFLQYPRLISRVTFWDVTDGDSWLNNWPVSGRVNYPLLFDREGQPKHAFDAVARRPETQ